MKKSTKVPSSDTAQALKEALASLGWSQATLARRLGKGQDAVSAWATGKVAVPAYTQEYLRVCLLAQNILM